MSCCKDDRAKKVKIVGPADRIANPTSGPSTPFPVDAALEAAIDLAGPQNGTQGVMPNAADVSNGIPHKDTPAKALVVTYPWLYKETDSAEDTAISTQRKGAQYFLYRGTGNNVYAYVDTSIYDKDSALTVDADEDYFATTVSDVGIWGYVDSATIQNNIQCQTPFNACTGAEDPDNFQYWMRLVRDSCTNQYILPMGLYPAYLYNENFRNNNYPWNESFCQALVLTPVGCSLDLVGDNTGGTCLKDYGERDNTMYDYRVWGFLELAWQQVLTNSYAPATTDPNKLTTTGSSLISLPAPIAGSEAYGQPFNASTPGNHEDSWDTTYSSNNNNRTTINDLRVRPYERIWDPTHPYSPRWDMTGKTDRDYTNDTLISGGGYNLVPSTCYVRCAAVPVDILTFRQVEFNDCMSCRIGVNNVCFWSDFIINMIPIAIYIPPFYIIPIGGGAPYILNLTTMPPTWPSTAFQDTLDGSDPVYEWFPGFQCKEHLQQQNNPVYSAANSSPPPSIGTGLNAGLWPPCSTQFDTPIDNAPGFVSPYTDTCEFCDILANDYANSTDHYSSVTKCCSDLAQALAPANTLKMRNILDDGFGLFDSAGNVPEGYKFKDYFQDHMPFMRWWDTGQAAGGGGWPNVTPLFLRIGTNYDPYCDKGYMDTIVGVGTEGTNGASPAGLCRYGGGGGKPYKCINIGASTTSPVDRLTSWYELKQYQINSIRNFGMNCLPMHEKMWKWVSEEDGALKQAGKHFNSKVLQSNDTTTNSLFQLKTNPWPLRWRGYLTDQQFGNTNTDVYRFPNFNPDSVAGTVPAASKFTGLDNAQVGDIIYVTANDPAAQPGGATPPVDHSVMPFMAVVTYAQHNTGKTLSSCTTAECTDATATCSDFVEVVDVNNGKYPDTCGITDYIGMGQTRRIVKEWLPTNIQDVLYRGTATTFVTDSCNDRHTISASALGIPLQYTANGHCMDPKYAVCKMGADWTTIQVYRPSLDERGH